MSVTLAVQPTHRASGVRSRGDRWVSAVAPFLLTALMVSVGYVIQIFVADLGVLDGAPYSLPWWALAPAFAVAGAFVVHVQVGRDVQFISLNELALVIGLGLADPRALIVGRIVGSAVAFLVSRRQPIDTLVFNLALAYMETTLAIVVFRAAIGAATPLDPRGWAAAMVAVIGAILIGWSLVTLVIALQDQSRKKKEIFRSFRLSAFLSSASGVFGLTFLMVAWLDGRALVFVLLLSGLLYAAVDAFSALARRHQDLESIFSFSRHIQQPQQTGDVIITTLNQTMKHMRAQRVEMIVFSPNHDEPSHVVSLKTDTDLSFEELEPGSAHDLLRMLLGHPGDSWFTPRRGSDWLRDHFTPRGFRSGLVSPIRTRDGVAAILACGNRFGPVDSFDEDDKEMLDMLARQASDTLARAELLERIEREAIEREERASSMVKTKDEFIASVSHEIRTPLTAVIGSAQLLQSGLEVMEEDERLELVGYIARESTELAHLVEDLLVNARAGVGTLTIKPELIDLTEETGRALNAVAGASDMPDVDVSAVSGMAFADPLRYRQIMRNLLTNAARYGGDTVTVETKRHRDEVYVRVCDDGDGIPLRDRDSVFEPYQSAHPTIGVTGSVGLGLSVARQLSELMAGHLTYRYSGGVSVFELRLPGNAKQAIRDSHANGSHNRPDRGLFAPRRDSDLPAGV